MTTPISGGSSPAPATPAPKAAPPASQAQAPAAQPPQEAVRPELRPLLKDPLLGEPFSLLQKGVPSARVLLPLGTVLANASLETLKSSYQTARDALSELMYDPKCDPKLRAQVGEVVTATMAVLQSRGVDPLAAPEPREVQFPLR